MSLKKSSDIPNPPTSTSVWSIRAFFALRDAQARWQFAARSALCIALPIAIGWLMGREADGLVATLGAFAGLFGASHTYRKRAPLLAWAAFGFVIAVLISALGALAPWLGVLTIALFGGVTVLICNSLRVGPPGAYMFVLACATGVSILARGSPLLHDVLLVAGGGALAWLVQMSGVLFVPNGPQRRVVLAASRAVYAFVQAVGTPGEDAARHFAASELYNAWEMLEDSTPGYSNVAAATPFDAVNKRAHLLFAMINQHERPLEELRKLAGKLVRDAEQLPVRRTRSIGRDVASSLSSFVPNALVRRRAFDMLRDGLLLPHSDARLNAFRATLAAALSGALGLTLGLEQAYWAVAAAVLILHQSGSRAGIVHRGAQRILGTLVGLVLAKGLIALHPQGLWLVLIVALLQFSIEITVVRNYALGVVFITPISLLIASSVVPSATNLVLARGLDTFVGVVVAFIVLFAVGRYALKQRLPGLIAKTLDGIEAVLDDLAQRDFTSIEARLDREKLQHALIDTRAAYDYGLGESRSTRQAIEPYWLSVVQVQRLGYDVLAACWAYEHTQSMPSLTPLQEALALGWQRLRALEAS